MVRPNHDIPNLLVGGIKDYASVQGIDDEDAHAELIRIGLSEVGILCADTEYEELKAVTDENQGQGAY